MKRVRQGVSLLITYLGLRWASEPKRRAWTAGFGLIVLLAGVNLGLWIWNRSRDVIIPGISVPEFVDRAEWMRLTIPQREPPFFALAPKTNNKYGILPSEQLTLTSREPVSAKFVQDNLESAVPMKVTQVNDRQLLLSPVSPMKLEQLLNVTLSVRGDETGGHTFDRNYSWSYQTQGKFRVTSTLPGDKKRNVPVNTGIEFTFSQDDYADPSPYLSVSPLFAYRTERHGETWAIVPIKPLEYKTIYTITLSPGVGLTSRNDPLGEIVQISFQTEEKPEIKQAGAINLVENFSQFTPSEPPAVKIYTSGWTEDKSVTAEVYKFGSGSEWLGTRKDVDAAAGYWWDFYQSSAPVDTSRAVKVTTADIKPQKRGEDYNQVEYLQLPAGLEEGYYVVQLWSNNRQALEQWWIQSTKTAGFVSVGRSQTLVWANNLETRQPEAGAAVEITGSGAAATTDSRGLAVFTTPSVLHETGYHYVRILGSGSEVYLPVKPLAGLEQNNQTVARDYWSYLYHERRMYKPTDTVSVWGVIKNRNTGSAPGTVRASITRGYGDSSIALASRDLAVSDTGTFIGSLPITELPEGWYSVNISVGQLVVESTGFQVLQYQKPEIQIEVESDKKAVFTGEEVTFTVRAGFFDRTPAKQMTLKITEDKTGKTTETVTDDQGGVVYKYRPEYTRREDFPRYESITIVPALSQQGKVEGHGSVLVYGSKLLLSTDSHQADKQARVTARLNRTDLGRAAAGLDPAGSPVGGQEIEATIVKSWWERIETGTYYDFIEKVTRPRYDYKRHEEKLPGQKLRTTSDGAAELSFEMEHDRSYQVILETRDEDGHAAQATSYFYYFAGSSFWSGDSSSNDTTPQLTLSKKENTFSIGETVGVTIKKNQLKYADTDRDSYLFIVANRGRQDYFVEDKPEMSFSFSDKHIPNVYIGAMIFTGDRYQPVSSGCSWDWYCYYDYSGYFFDGVEVRYQSLDRQLTVRVKTDKPKYGPGETAQIEVSVMRNGQPAGDARVNLALVDQALAAIGGVVEPSTLSRLYSPVPAQVYYNYYSHRPVWPNIPAAEKGGGGGDYREIFKDTAYFNQAVTNAEGRATMQVKLPDNLTTWIAYAQAVDNNLFAGHTNALVTVSKDFFVTSQFPGEILVSDQASLAANGFGSRVNPGDPISFTARWLAGDQELAKSDKSGPAGTDTDMPFPKLEAGSYRLGLNGKTSGELTDGVLLPFTVIDSRLNFAAAKTFSIDSGKEELLSWGSFRPDRPVTLVVSDTGRGRYYQQLSWWCFENSSRLEKNLTRLQAGQVLSEKLKGKGCPGTAVRAGDWQETDGGLGQVKWGGSQLETTIWAIRTRLLTGVDEAKLAEYLISRFNDDQGGSMQKVYASWGLVLLGKPYLNQLQVLAGQSVSPREKLMAALALADAGQIEQAREMYFDLLSDYGYSARPYIRIQTEMGGREDDYLKDSAAALLLGSMVEKEYNGGLYSYLRDYQSTAQDVVLDLAQISFIAEELDKLPAEDTRVTINTPSRQLTLDLSRGERATLELARAETGGVRVRTLSGKAEAVVNYFSDAAALSGMNRDPRLKLSRTYTKVRGTGPIRPGDLVQITLRFELGKDSPLGSYTITDHLPSGLAFLSNPYDYGLESKGWATQTQNQVIRAYVYNSLWREYTVPVVRYFARATAPGKYTAEPAIFQSGLDTGVLTVTDQTAVEIEK